MDVTERHGWDIDPKDAADLQRDLAGRVDVTSPLGRCELVAGADVSYDRGSPTLYATVVVLRLPDFDVVETRDAAREATFPYVPGMLSFREVPALLECFRALETVPDLVICDGQGLAHPRRFGLACHLGLWLNLPCLGCAKSRLVGEFVEPGVESGSGSPLTHQGERVGTVLRTRAKVKPVFVSPGHLITLADAESAVLAACNGYRLPETTRAADGRANQLRSGEI